MLSRVKKSSAFTTYAAEARQKKMIIFVPLFALIAVAYVFRDDLGVRALIAYLVVWLSGLAAFLALGWSPGVFTAIECALAIAMLIHVRANPEL